jgi:hypothetical protein
MDNPLGIASRTHKMLYNQMIHYLLIRTQGVHPVQEDADEADGEVRRIETSEE